MRAAAKCGGACARQGGFTLTEMLVVVSIVGIVVGLSLPNIARAIDNAELNGATQKLVYVYQDARLRATQDNAAYQIVASASGVSPARLCIDLDGNGACGPGEPTTVFSTHVSLQALTGDGIPLLGTAQLGFSAVDVDPSLGIGWNGLGAPCQRSSSVSPCLAVGWVEYLRYQRSNGDILYSAVSVSPTGRIKTWNYSPSESGNGTWF